MCVPFIFTLIATKTDGQYLSFIKVAEIHIQKKVYDFLASEAPKRPTKIRLCPNFEAEILDFVCI